MNFKQTVERWGIYELSQQGPKEGNPFIEVNFGAQFKFKNRTVEVDGFYDGDGVFKVRYMPDQQGKWSFITSSNCDDLNGISGEFECTSPSQSNHGPVRVKNIYNFAYEDGTPHLSVGTTCYVWNHQGEELERKTIETLKTAPFNNIRMCVFPKSYDFNNNEPVYYPFEGTLESGWDFTRFNPAFFTHLEKCIYNLMEIGIEADLILLHPYDRWGFASMDAETDDRYMKYIVSRLASYRNIWWSFANEYDFMSKKTIEDWDRYFTIVQERDPSQHLRSIHNGNTFYDHTKPWVTHCSIQSSDIGKVYEWRDLYRKPVVIDECCYEGNINHSWGNITGQELVHRFWDGFFKGGYVGHGETYMHPDDILWWAKGGVLHGSSPERIAFMRKIFEEIPEGELTPSINNWDSQHIGKEGEHYLIYYGIRQPAFKEVNLPEDRQFKIEIIDAWNMTITPVDGKFCGKVKVNLPAKQYIALRIRRCE